MTKKIAQVVVGLPIEGPFDYFLPDSFRAKAAIGSRVKVPFGPRWLTGYVVNLSEKSYFKKLKPVLSLLDVHPLIENHQLKFAKEFAAYYCCSLGEAIEAMLPSALRKGQEAAFDFSVQNPVKRKPQTILLHDQDGTKKWPFLFEKIKATLAQNQGVIFLVPVVSMLEALETKLKENINETVVILDKRLSAKKELKNWLEVKEGKAKLVIGSRSAIFAPVSNLGLIVIDEENNSAYKQEQSPFYHAREVAFLRSKINGADLILSSAAPSAEIWSLAKKKKVKIESFESERTPAVQIVDLSAFERKKFTLFSFPLKNTIEKVLLEKEKVLLLMNRRGFSTCTHCKQCGYTLKCKRCNANLIYLYSQKKMVCRHCNYTTQPPTLCLQCRSSYLRYSGAGIEKLESELARMFPQARLARYDKDSAILPVDFDILIATQAILKWKEKCTFAVSAVLQFDSELNHLDFRSSEKAFSLLCHLKGMTTKKLIVQTRMIDNYVLKAASKSNFEMFYKQELQFRRQLHLPPFFHLICLIVRGKKEDVVLEQANALCEHFQKADNKDIEINEPQVHVIPKLRDQYRFNIFLKSKEIAGAVRFVQNCLKSFKKKSGIIIAVDVDF